MHTHTHTHAFPQLLSDLLDMTKIESGKMEMCVEACDVQDLVSHAVETFTHSHTHTHPQTHPPTPTHPHTHTHKYTHTHTQIPTHPHTFRSSSLTYST